MPSCRNPTIRYSGRNAQSGNEYVCPTSGFRYSWIAEPQVTVDRPYQEFFPGTAIQMPLHFDRKLEKRDLSARFPSLL